MKNIEHLLLKKVMILSYFLQLNKKNFIHIFIVVVGTYADWLLPLPLVPNVGRNDRDVPPWDKSTKNKELVTTHSAILRQGL
jgi:hypothetical protein